MQPPVYLAVISSVMRVCFNEIEQMSRSLVLSLRLIRSALRLVRSFSSKLASRLPLTSHDVSLLIGVQRHLGYLKFRGTKIQD